MGRALDDAYKRARYAPIRVVPRINLRLLFVRDEGIFILSRSPVSCKVIATKKRHGIINLEMEEVLL